MFVFGFAKSAVMPMHAWLPGLFGSDDRNYSYLGARGFMRPGDFDSRFLVLTVYAVRMSALAIGEQVQPDAEIDLRTP